MQIESIICPDYVEAKLEVKHGVTFREARQALLGRARIRLAEKGHTEGEDVYACFGQTLGGRYLAVFFIYKPTSQTAVIISAREMNEKERRTYEPMDANKLSSISQADTDEGMGEFWDTHDFTEFDNPDLPDVKFTMTCTVPIEIELFSALEKQAQQRGVQVETLANLWLQQKLVEQRRYAPA